MGLDPARRDLRATDGPHPVARLYVLDAPDGAAVSIRRLPSRDCFAALLRNSFQLDLVGRGQARKLFEQAGELAAALPIRRLAYERTFGQLPAVCDAILADLGEPNLSLCRGYLPLRTTAG